MGESCFLRFREFLVSFKTFSRIKRRNIAYALILLLYVGHKILLSRCVRESSFSKRSGPFREI